jgi:heat-inducible transcriptional repressor
MALETREEVLLRTLIKLYIEDGQPIGSRTLAREAGLELSPATIRNVLSDLERMGLIRSPHTSAGRVPTELGYRLFVDSLVKVAPLNRKALEQIRDSLTGKTDPDQLLESASELLSNLTHLAGLVTLPRREQGALRQLEFVPLAEDRILVILVTQEGRVQNRVITVQRQYTPSELVTTANYFNERFSGMLLNDVKHALVRELAEDSDNLHRYTQAAVEVARRALLDGDGEEEGDGLLVSGEANLFDIPDLSDVTILRRLFDAFKTKQDLLHLLDKSMDANGIQIFIGGESGYTALDDCSVVAAPYTVDGKIVGTLGVVGPTRMSYEQVIPVVDLTARLLGAALKAS